MLILLVILQSLSFATIENFRVNNGASNTDIDEANNTYIIYAGISPRCPDGAGCNTCALVDFNSTSNNPEAVCNERALHHNTPLEISFSSTDANGAAPYIIATKDAPITNICNTGSNRGNDGTNLTIICTWGQICAATTGGADCSGLTSLSTLTLLIGKDVDNGNDLNAEDNDDFIEVKFNISNESMYDIISSETSCSSLKGGICTYEMFPGDKKAYIDQTAPSFANISKGGDTRYTSLRVYYEEAATMPPQSCDAIKGNFSYASSFKDIAYSSTAVTLIGNQFVGNLVNEKAYCFRMAVVDQTGFISSLTAADDPSFLTSRIVPSPVVGLIEDGNCFIATAAFGTAIDARLDILRAFRDQILNTTKLGSHFVDFYYANAKPVAIWVAQNPIAKKIVELSLYPIIALAYVLLNPIYLLFLLLPLGLMLIKRKVAR